MRIVRINKLSNLAKKTFGENLTSNVIYFNSEEFFEKAKKGLEVCNILIKTNEELDDLLKKDILITKKRPEDISSMNIWLQSGDNYVPDYLDMFSRKIVYLKDYMGNYIPTDGCIMKLLRIRRISYYQHSITCCNGTQYVRMYDKGRLGITAALMPNIQYLTGMQSNYSYRLYNDIRKINRYLKAQRPHRLEIKAVHLILNPISPYFLDVYKAVSKSLGIKDYNVIRKYIESNKFRSIFMNEIKILMPEVANAIKQAIPPSKIAEYLKLGIEKSLKEETTEELRNNLQFVINLAYESVLSNPNKTITEDYIPPLSIASDSSKLIPDTSKGMIIDSIDGYANEFMENFNENSEELNDELLND